jgi:atypical dual specificity phosphatase
MSGWFPKAAFFPTLAYNVLLEKLSLRPWYSRIDETVLLGALPFRSFTEEVCGTRQINICVAVWENQSHGQNLRYCVFYIN